MLRHKGSAEMRERVEEKERKDIMQAFSLEAWCKIWQESYLYVQHPLEI